MYQVTDLVKICFQLCPLPILKSEGELKSIIVCKHLAEDIWWMMTMAFLDVIKIEPTVSVGDGLLVDDQIAFVSEFNLTGLA